MLLDRLSPERCHEAPPLTSNLSTTTFSTSLSNTFGDHDRDNSDPRSRSRKRLRVRQQDMDAQAERMRFKWINNSVLTISLFTIDISRSFPSQPTQRSASQNAILKSISKAISQRSHPFKTILHSACVSIPHREM